MVQMETRRACAQACWPQPHLNVGLETRAGPVLICLSGTAARLHWGAASRSHTCVRLRPGILTLLGFAALDRALGLLGHAAQGLAGGSRDIAGSLA